MTDAFNVMEVASSGAGVLVAEMARTSWQSARDAMARFFHLGGEESAPEELRVLDLRHATLVGSPENERAAVSEELRTQVAIQLAAFLMKHPDAAAVLQALVTDRTSEQSGSAPQVTATGNTNSQVVTANGSIGSVSYNSPGVAR
ncbi:hypothetical protein [Streptomyces sp. CB02115]|uniref:hypothetical protein n=1 Tax=Streptomyces sp. CB02115 TaxID=1703939 RepID=UPI00093B88A2|nr:hypothetical protein [Streptomyces sp. CB02115]OKJ49306.1 hypothetical protein AMK28_33005 [Streptomyces sp. CB02115]